MNLQFYLDFLKVRIGMKQLQGKQHVTTARLINASSTVVKLT